ncbi:MAG: hypothetical protein ACRC1K_24705 [Planctomycetia bacterium]
MINLQQSDFESFRATAVVGALAHMLSDMAHEFNNIMTVVPICADLLARRVPPATIVAELTKTIHDSVERGKNLTRRMQQFRETPGQMRDGCDWTETVDEAFGRLLKAVDGPPPRPCHASSPRLVDCDQSCLMHVTTISICLWFEASRACEAATLGFDETADDGSWVLEIVPLAAADAPVDWLKWRTQFNRVGENGPGLGLEGMLLSQLLELGGGSLAVRPEPSGVVLSMRLPRTVVSN